MSLPDTWPSRFRRGTVSPPAGVTFDTTTSSSIIASATATLYPLSLTTLFRSYTVPASALAGTATNSATVSATSADNTGAKNTGSHDTTPVARQDVKATKTGRPDPVTAGTNITYTITVSNNSTASSGTTATNISPDEPARHLAEPLQTGHGQPARGCDLRHDDLLVHHRFRHRDPLPSFPHDALPILHRARQRARRDGHQQRHRERHERRQHRRQEHRLTRHHASRPARRQGHQDRQTRPGHRRHQHHVHDHGQQQQHRLERYDRDQHQPG